MNAFPEQLFGHEPEVQDKRNGKVSGINRIIDQSHHKNTGYVLDGIIDLAMRID